MSELKTNKITSEDSSRKLTVNSGVEIVSNSRKVFEVTDAGNLLFSSSLLLGNQAGATHGGSIQMVTSNGANAPLSWTTFNFDNACANTDAGIPANVILEYLVVGFYDGCSSNTISSPDAPEGYVFCDGQNGTPDLRTSTNSITGIKDFEGNCGDSNNYYPGVWTRYYIIKL